MNDPRIQFLAFNGCPLAEPARKALDEAMGSLNLSGYEVIDILDPETPEELKKWGSPTILVNGQDVTGGEQGDSIGCRVYSGPDRVPEASAIADFISRNRGLPPI